MDKFVKEISTNKYICLSQAEFDVDPSLYVDRSDRPHYLLSHYSECGMTYWQARRKVVALVDSAANGFNDFNDIDKEALGIFAYGDKDETVSFYESSKGLSNTDANGLNLIRVSENRALMAIYAKIIAASPKLIQIGVKYLTTIFDGELDSSQAFELTDAIKGFRSQYENYAELGSNYGDEYEAIMDYFESTGSYVNSGLKNYTFNPLLVAAYGSEEAVRLAMISELQDLFVNGNT